MLSTCALFTQQLSVLFPSYYPGILPQVRDHVNSIEDVQAAPTQEQLRKSLDSTTSSQHEEILGQSLYPFVQARV